MLNGTYEGGGGDTKAILKITDSDANRDIINVGTYEYGGRVYDVRGNFYYMSQPNTKVVINLTLASRDGSPDFEMKLMSPDKTYSLLQGTVSYFGGGAAVFSASLGKTA
ncbi:hypothetical protein [Pseudomonas sp. FSL W5-0299]|jgi:hypothetical protein|uniref:hypothetical protein n=1 Tax=Pseudomonas sp. FSL W5-0299 TaxID=1917484 RepID=UPI00098BBF47|nr:hypothetical protein [Pseudomonas sp. FSL W5-0299]MDF9884402.1 hypothetical protein [Pseudomonas silensiensis]OOL39633.1 hypothetical protein BOO94_01415 [Pseudomonas sp. FSL W5-0299]